MPVIASLYTLFFLLFVTLFMLISVTFFIPLGILHILHLHRKRIWLTTILAHFWARMLLFITGTRVKVHGKEHFPKDNRYCLIANHQGIFDIPLILSVVPQNIAFIAKEELRKTPLIGWWMQAIGVLFLDRSSTRQALSVITTGAQRLQQGNPLVIFPEGTRSKGKSVGNFKKGSMKLATKSKVPIIPVSISGSFRIFEETRRIRPSTVSIQIHAPVHPQNLTKDEMAQLHEHLQSIIAAGVSP
ncbi:lysophospholipid acyltransferase family protein [Chitinivibrio alkaliphilus]|uniref:1-acyl-sn-glycerol-3-phosphate acyltransferase n=1 Tax=Chitinivibrio alkaliphilus ACht1 TaxID=1313304 RepID=U7DCH6_9BACT|nr:lysophospholipid acyltransferase family protein [Chitinivibrio alkaliphilus]ERP32135.1 1-acyl-sn-glycerol-3-phosphate acyltransferase [Chitinivibrio alkaliphilus ACht1]